MGILKLSEKGVLYSLKDKWFNSNETHCDLDEKSSAEGTQFDMESVGGLFVVLIGGIIIAIIIGICEFLWNIQQIAVNEKVIQQNNTYLRVYTFVCNSNTIIIISLCLSLF